VSAAFRRVDCFSGLRRPVACRKLEKQMAWHESNPDFRIFQAREIWVRRGNSRSTRLPRTKKARDIFLTKASPVHGYAVFGRH